MLQNNGYVVHATIPNILKLMNLSYLFGKNIESYKDYLTLYYKKKKKIIQKLEL